MKTRRIRCNVCGRLFKRNKLKKARSFPDFLMSNSGLECRDDKSCEAECDRLNEKNRIAANRNCICEQYTSTECPIHCQ